MTDYLLHISEPYSRVTYAANGDILLSLEPRGMREIIDDLPNDPADDDVILHLIEDWLGNGWEAVDPHDVGALTGGLIISEEVERDEAGDTVHVGAVYWHADYQVQDVLADLLAGKSVRLVYVPSVD